MFWTGFAPSTGVLRRVLRKWGVAAVVAVGFVAGAAVTTAAQARTTDNPGQGAAVALATLPLQAQATYRLVLSGGPFPYPKDGVVFGNRERQLPRKARGFYREYTVKTPGSRDRGARRVVCGGEPPSRPEVCYYTDDHYASFSRIVP